MKQRILTGTVIAIFVILVLLAPTSVVIGAVMLISAVALYEYLKTVGLLSQKGFCVLGFVACLLLPLGKSFSPSMVQSLVFLYFLALFVMFLYYHKEAAWKDLSLLVMGVVYIPYFLSHLVYIRTLPLGGIYIWLALIGACITDTCAYFAGVTLGRHKLCPAISPKKTIEGAIGGSLGCGALFVVFALLVNHFFPSALKGETLSLWKIFVTGLACSVVSQIGDLTASLLKRQFGVKDFGNLLPGHGGVLDRCDSLILVAPAVYLVLQLLGVLA